SSSRPSNPAASPASGPSPRSGSIAHEQHPVVAAPIAPPVRQRYPAGNSHTLPMAPSASTSAAKTPDPSTRRHEAHGTHANQNHRPRYPFKPAVPSESSQVAQNLALNPHRPTLPPAHTPPAVSSFEAFRTPASVQPLAQSLPGIRKPLTIPALHAVVPEWGGSTPKPPLAARETSTAHDPFRRSRRADTKRKKALKPRASAFVKGFRMPASHCA